MSEKPPIKIPKIITRRNRAALIKAFDKEPYFQIGIGALYDPDAWYWKEVILEFPLGEMMSEQTLTLALVGKGGTYEIMDLTGKEGFDAQGLEGKVQVRKPLWNAVINLNLLPVNRGRVITKGK